MKYTRQYETLIRGKWENMHKRCRYGSGNYGKFGIVVCSEWSGENGFANFYEWSIANGFKPGLVLDRKDTYGSYSPDNCRWITCRKNNLNKTNTVFVKVNGKNVPLSEYCQAAPEPSLKLYNRIYKRRQRGWPEERMLEVRN